MVEHKDCVPGEWILCCGVGFLFLLQFDCIVFGLAARFSTASGSSVWSCVCFCVFIFVIFVLVCFFLRR